MKVLLLVLCAVFAAAVTVVDPEPGGSGRHEPARAPKTSLEKEPSNEQKRTRLHSWAQENLASRLIQSATVTQPVPGSQIWTLEVVVKSGWHAVPKRARKEAASAMWSAWARQASPRKQDAARIKILSRSGDVVGGSRVWGGSLIWVED